MQTMNKSKDVFLTKAQFEARKTAGTLEEGIIYHITDVKYATQAEVEAVKSLAMNITAPSGATAGNLTDEQMTILQASDSNFIMYDHEKYYLEDKGHIEGYLTYTHAGYENNQMWLKSITVTIATKTWVLNVVGVKPMVVLTQSEYDALTDKDANTLYYIIG